MVVSFMQYLLTNFMKILLFHSKEFALYGIMYLFVFVLCFTGCGDIVVEEMAEKHCSNLWDFLDEPNQVVSYSHSNS